MSNISIETIDLKKSFNHLKNSITVFNNFNVKIKEGELVALVGPSGSGKSSLLHLLGLLDDPTSGKIIINKKNTKSLSISEKDTIRRENISIMGIYNFSDSNILGRFSELSIGIDFFYNITGDL